MNVLGKKAKFANITRTICLGMAIVVLGTSMSSQAYDTPEDVATRVSCRKCVDKCVSTLGSGIAFDLCKTNCWNSSECKVKR